MVKFDPYKSIKEQLEALFQAALEKVIADIERSKNG